MAEGGAADNEDPLMLDHITEEIAEMGSDFLTHASSNESPAVAVTPKDDVLGFLGDVHKSKDFLSCINCKQGFDTIRQRPLLLPCLTAICKQCLLDFLASHFTSIECSYCKCLHACVENDSIILPRDSIREGMLAIFRLMNGESDLRCEMCTGTKKASHHCFDCSLFICDDCTKLHSSLRTLMGHSYVEIKSLLTRDMESLKLFSSTLYCSTPGHEQKMVELFCSSESCKRLVCLLCAVNAHKTHKLCDVSQVVNEKNNALRELKESLNARYEQSCISLRVIKEKKDECSTESAQLEKEIRMCFSKAKMVLEKREKELCDDLKEKQNERQTVLDLEKKRLNNFVDTCMKACQYVDAANALQCHSSVLSVSTYMESRLKSLECVSPTIDSFSSFEKMKFIPKELKLSIVNAGNFGEILTTKASFSKSEASAIPLVCTVGLEITFTVKLKTSSGRLINDEDVQVRICQNGKLLKAIPCILGQCSNYTGTWIPDKPMKTTWHILSNGIELDLPREGNLQAVDSCNREKDKLKQRGRRNRRFKTKETESDKTPSVLSSDALQVKVKDDFIVRVYQGSITKLGVDCIVNAANDQLMHGGGVAYTISEAAGYEFDRESAEYIRNNGRIPVGKCCVTSAGKLPYKCVIHTVGPRWHDYKNDEKQYCLEDLQEAVEVTFREAEKLEMTSVAIPSISAGIFGVPKDKCVECYYQAVISFISSKNRSYLKEIHFVDRDPTMVDSIKAVFAHLTNVLPTQGSTSRFLYSTSSQQIQGNSNISKTYFTSYRPSKQ